MDLKNQDNTGHKSNRFFEYSKPKQGVLIIFFILLLVISLEVLALLTAFCLPYTGLTKHNKLFIEYKDKLHPLISGDLLNISGNRVKLGNRTLTKYDPWFGYRNPGNFKLKNFPTDKYGFIVNGEPAGDISKKPPGTYRIFVLGGSTVAGLGVGSPGNTITAQLEDMLNSSPGDNRPQFQVINAGIVGWYSPQEVALAQFELLYYKPDMIITFDGLNDMVESSDRSDKTTEKYYWHSYQSMLKEQISNPRISIKLFAEAFTNSPLNPARNFYSLNLAFYKIPGLLTRFFSKRKQLRESLSKEIAERLNIARKNARLPKWCWKNIVEIDDWLEYDEINRAPEADNVFFADRYIRNLKNLSVICKANNIDYLAVLQPMLIPEFKEHLSELEKFAYYCEMHNFYYFQSDKKNYRLSALNYYKRCIELAEKELGGVFHDRSKMFYDVDMQLYSDWWHYNPRGNKLIARTLKPLVENRLKKRVLK